MNNLTEKDYSVVPAKSSFRFHEFSGTLFGSEVGFKILKMEESYFIWIGLLTEKNLSDLSMAMMTRFQPMPLSSHLLGSTTDINSKSLATKLSKKLGKQILLSYNLKDQLMLPEVEKLLWQEIKNNSDIF